MLHRPRQRSRRKLAHKKGSLDLRLVPGTGFREEGVDLGRGGDGEDGLDGGVVTPEDGEVEFCVGACGDGGCVEGFGFVVGCLDGDGVGLRVAVLMALAGFAGCHDG